MTLGRTYYCGLKENPINKKPKEDTITVTPTDNSINEDPQELQDPQRLLRCKLTLFGFLVMVYEKVDDGDKISRPWKALFSCEQSLKN